MNDHQRYDEDSLDVAVVGLAGRFPGAVDVDALWRNLAAGVESIRPFSDEELAAFGVDPEFLRDPSFVKAGAVLEGADRFDAGFFGYSPREAALIDPQHRVFLECAWQAMENAGYAPGQAVAGADAAPLTGVYAAVGMNSYLLFNLLGGRRPDLRNFLELILSNDKDFLSTRVSYKLNLQGPSIDVQSACSSSLVAINLACQGLLTFQCDMALAGGVAVQVPQLTGYFHQRNDNVYSPDGHCRAFDAKGGGTVFGSGVGTVVLKRVGDAVVDGDTIHAVIKGSAVNNDGALKLGFTAPSTEGQAKVIDMAYANAGIEPESVTYVEAHGTGTALGDPIEVAALSQVFGPSSDGERCALGSIKSNLGHLDSAAGVAGLIKTILALQHRQIPPSLHFEDPNPQIDFTSSGFWVPHELTEWSSPEGEPRRAGISSFGMGGTNAHALVEEALDPGPSPAPSRPWQLLVLSARTGDDLERMAANLGGHLRDSPESGSQLADVAWTLQIGRGRLARRQIVVARTPEEAAEALASGDPERVRVATAQGGEPPSVAFLFPGQGAQYPGMSRRLYASEESYRQWVDRAAERLQSRLGLDLRTLLLAEDGAEESLERRLAETRITQPALFIVELGLAQLWRKWGIEPQAMLGHSIGEWVAACLAGVLSADAALELVTLRGEMMQRAPTGAMLSVPLSEAELLGHLGEELSLAAVNGPQDCVVSGRPAAVEALATALAQDGVETRRLRTSHAFHSYMMEKVAEAFAREVARVDLAEPSLPWISNVTGDWITPQEATDPTYWGRQLRGTVRFSAGLKRLLEPNRVLLEIGPGATLSTLARRHSDESPVVAVPSLPRPTESVSDVQRTMAALGRLWLAGVEPDWRAIHGDDSRRRVPLPSYPFVGGRYWIDPASGDAVNGLADTGTLEAGGEEDRAQTRHERPGLDVAYVAPRDEVEKGLAEIWGQLLGIGRIGIHDDFFELGGHSLLGTQVISRVREALGVELRLEQIFEGPTVVSLATAVALATADSDEKSEASQPSIETLPRGDGESTFPLSFAQERLWFIDQWQPGSWLYNIPVTVRVEGALDLAVLRSAVVHLVARHESLRTCFEARDGKPVQKVAAWTPSVADGVEVAEWDLRALAPARREQEALHLAAFEARQPFDLTSGPLLRLTVVRCAEEKFLLLLTLHHIVADNWSFGVLIRELAASCEALVRGEAPMFPALPVQYADFAVWQRHQLKGESLEQELDFWRQRLAGAPPVLDLPTDRPRPPVQSFYGATEPVALDHSLHEPLAQQCRRLGATPYMFLLAAFKALLFRMSGERDLVVGSPIANRNRAETEGLIGFFVNTQVHRTDLAGNPSFRELVDRVREGALAAYDHQDLPFEKLTEELHPERSLSHTPIFQMMFVLQNAPLTRTELPGVSWELLEVETGRSKFDLTLLLDENEEGWAGLFSFATDLFDRTTVRRLGTHFQRLVAAAVEDPEICLSTLPLIGGVERHQMLAEWNAQRVAYRADGLLHEQIEDWARRTPDVRSVVIGPRHLSYGQLDQRANGVARVLGALSVEAGEPVGLLVERSPEMVIGMLGIMKSGGAYVPLDPAYPEQRLKYMIEDSGMRIMVAQEHLLDSRDRVGVETVPIERQAPADSSPHVDVDPAHPAYVIYTSGSTGRPKGVTVSHRAIVNRTRFSAAYDDFRPSDRCFQKTTISFDSSVMEIFGPLVAGGTLVLARPDGERDGAYLVDALERLQLQFVSFAPSMYQALLEEGDLARFGSLRTLMCGGEAMSVDLPGRVLDEPALRRDVRLYNRYGPTEAAVGVLSHRCGLREASTVPIGRPMARMGAYVADPRLQPVAVGTAGALCVGGVGLAQDYHQRPSLTAERFLPDAFGGGWGQRLFNTGDLARFRADGEIEFLGRIDHQVKVRGFRVELGEIEAAMAELPAVLRCAVLVREIAGTKQLVAYVEGGGSQEVEAGLDPETLRQSLAARLPAYMVPSFVLEMRPMPLLPNGKIDRRALPEPELAATELVPPRTPAEELLAEIWAGLLNRPQVGLYDDFFELGGHSLLATQLISRIRDAFGVGLPVAVVFEASTLIEMAERLAAAGGGEAMSSGMADLPSIPRDGELPLSYAQERLWFLDRFEPGNTALNMSAALSMRGLLDVAALAAAFTEIVRRHEVLRSRFGAEGGRPRLSLMAPWPVDVAWLDLSTLGGAAIEAEIHRLQRFDAERPFDLEQGRLLRATVARRAVDDHVLFVSVHHIVSDGWSVALLIRELSALYEARTVGQALPELPVQYVDYAAWQRDLCSETVLAEQRESWREALAGAPALLELPTDRPRPAVRTSRGEVREQRLPEALSEALRDFGRSQGATLFMVQLAALDLLLKRLSGQDDVLVGVPVAGRQHRQVEDLIGCFLNTLVVRGDLSGDPSFVELLTQIRQTALSAYAAQDVPFESVLEAVQPERDLSHTPIFQVFFNMLNLPASRFGLGDLRIEPLSQDEEEAKFDLTIYASVDEPQIGLRWVWNADLFNRRRMAEMAAQYQAILEQVVASPEAPLSAVSLLTPAARAALVNPDEALDATFRGAVFEIFAQRAQQAPDRLAIRDASTHLSYGALRRQSGALALRLFEAGVRRGDVVAIYAHRSAPLVSATLGILEAGGAFLMLDPAYPPPRLVACLEAAEVQAVVLLEDAGPVPEEMAAWLSVLPAARCLVLASADSVPPVDPAIETHRPAIGPEDRAYVAFTSGSAGQPKGIVGRHGSLTHFTPWQQQAFDLDADDRYSLLSALSHDPLHRDVFTPLQLGATIVIPDPEDFGRPGQLARWLREERVTIAHLTPAMGRLLSEPPPSFDSSDGEPEVAAALRRVFLVGEALTRQDVERLWAMAPRVRCVNYYGSTETQRAVGFYPVPRDGEGGERHEITPLGRGVGDAQVLILRDLAPAGLGELGEILMRSPHLALGYLDDPARTAASFTPDPFAGQTGGRVYRTGDLGRYLLDGAADFAGRADQQVKIRGFRVEPGEIESLLAAHADVAEAMVGVVDSAKIGPRLVAWVLPETVVAERLLDDLRQRLPDYMVPSLYVAMDHLPRTVTGKVDRRALLRSDLKAAWSSSDAASSAEARPATPTEELLSGIWGDVLGLERVGLQDDFFALGGHSLLATQVASRVTRDFGVELPVRALFEAPTLARLAREIDRLSASGAGVEAFEAPVLEPVARLDSLPVEPPPLSFAQERLWFLDRLAPGSSAYHITAALQVTGRLNVAWLEACLTEIIRRHESLRTVFGEIDGQPVQRVQTASGFRVPVVDLAALTDAEGRTGDRASDMTDAEARRLGQVAALAPFDLADGPLLRVLAVRLAADDYRVTVTQHHIISDGWSLGLLVREIVELYTALAEERAPALASLSIQTVDFAAWQRSWLSDAVLDQRLTFWRDQLAGAPRVLELPTDRPRPPMPSYRGQAEAMTLSHQLCRELEELARRKGVTLFMTLMAAFQVLLSRASGQKDLLVGTPIANRERPEIEDLIGLFVNTLVMRGDLTDRPSLREHLARVRERSLLAYAHQDMPFEKLVDVLEPARDLSRSPLFQVLFTLQNAPAEALELPGLTITLPTAEVRTAKFDLSLTLLERQGEIVAAWEYATDLFDATTVRRWGHQFRQVLDHLIHRPEESCDQVPLLAAAERQQLLTEWNDTWASDKVRAGVREGHLLARLVCRTTGRDDAIAAVGQQAFLSLGELHRRRLALAQELRRRGVARGTRVGVALDHTPDLLIALLAVLEAGGLYVPLDLVLPEERLRWMIDDGPADDAVALILTHPELAERLPDGGPPQLSPSEISPSSEESQTSSEIDANDLAYVIYTSGSTGRPKGVRISHGALLNFLDSMERRPGLKPSDVLVAATSLSFDIASLELFLPLLTGARLVLAERDDAVDGHRLATLLEQQRATVFQATPSAWRLLVETAWRGGDDFVALTGGEPLPPTLASELVERAGAVWNLYGPTETTVWSSVFPVDAHTAHHIRVGRPIANTSVHVLDRSFDLALPGAVGELWIGGQGVACNYFHRPALTAERFVPDPFAVDRGQRLYRTGDLARWRPEGELEHLGRVDFQVKLRGHRIELGEIEAALTRAHAVRQAAVATWQDPSGEPHLVAWVLSAGETTLDADDLRQHLRQSLPETMIPTFFVELEEVPLTASGKLDRRALPAPDLESSAAAYVAPRTPLEEVMVGIWQEFLPVERVGVFDNFFALGGHSLLAIRVLARVESVFDVRLPVTALFTAPTVAATAEAIDEEILRRIETMTDEEAELLIPRMLELQEQS